MFENQHTDWRGTQTTSPPVTMINSPSCYTLYLINTISAERTLGREPLSAAPFFSSLDYCCIILFIFCIVLDKVCGVATVHHSSHTHQIQLYFCSGSWISSEQICLWSPITNVHFLTVIPHAFMDTSFTWYNRWGWQCLNNLVEFLSILIPGHHVHVLSCPLCICLSVCLSITRSYYSFHLIISLSMLSTFIYPASPNPHSVCL